MKTDADSEARQNVKGTRQRDKRSSAAKTKASPLDVEAVDLRLSGDTIVKLVRKMHRRPR